MFKKIAALALVVSAAAASAVVVAGPAYADGPKNAKEAAACKALVSMVMPLLANSGACDVQKSD